MEGLNKEEATRDRISHLLFFSPSVRQGDFCFSLQGRRARVNVYLNAYEANGGRQTVLTALGESDSDWLISKKPVEIELRFTVPYTC